MPGVLEPPSIFPELTCADLDAFRTSAWYTRFREVAVKTTIVPLGDDFRAYMLADGVFVPEGSDNAPALSTLSDDEDDAHPCDGEHEHEDEEAPRYAFPDIDVAIRATVDEYGAVFPKLNWSSPKDARWIAPAPALRCLAPADVYLLLKSSDFVSGSVDPAHAYAGCTDDEGGAVPLELVLKKYYDVQENREIRAFVRRGVLLAIAQRDPNRYDFWQDPRTQAIVRDVVSRFESNEVAQRWEGPSSYTVDLLLTRDLSRAHVLDFNPWAPRTDALLFTWDELAHLPDDAAPVLRVVEHDGQPAAPAHAHNMAPLDALRVAAGRDAAGFADEWVDTLQRAVEEQRREDAEE